MAKKKDTSGYLSNRESRRIAKENRKITDQFEKRYKRKNVPEEEYLTEMHDRNNVLEIDDLHTYFFTDAGTVKAVEMRPHTSGTMMMSVVIQNDHQQTLCPDIKPRTAQEVKALSAEQLIGIIGHLDIVPARREDGWDTDPFVMTEKDGVLRDGEVFLTSRFSQPTEFDPAEGILWCKPVLAAGETAEWILSFGKGEIFAFDYDEEKQKTLLWWQTDSLPLRADC